MSGWEQVQRARLLGNGVLRCDGHGDGTECSRELLSDYSWSEVLGADATPHHVHETRSIRSALRALRGFELFEFLRPRFQHQTAASDPLKPLALTLRACLHPLQSPRAAQALSSPRQPSPSTPATP